MAVSGTLDFSILNYYAKIIFIPQHITSILNNKLEGNDKKTHNSTVLTMCLVVSI